MKSIFVFLYFVGYCGAVFGQKHDKATFQNDPSEAVKVTLQYLSREAVNNFYLDDEGVKHPVHNTRGEAIGYLRQMAARRSNNVATGKFTLPKTLYVWKAIDAYQDEEKQEVIYFDASRDIIYKKPPEK
ncbi:hypothetical protein JYU16_00155 [bacterium AH-315-M05]|nr:hypothetical protein [bacterium AH-315-M05]